MTKFTLQIETDNSDDLAHIAILADLILTPQPTELNPANVSGALDVLLSMVSDFITEWAWGEYPEETVEMVRYMDTRMRDIHRDIDELQRVKE